MLMLMLNTNAYTNTNNNNNKNNSNKIIIIITYLYVNTEDVYLSPRKPLYPKVQEAIRLLRTINIRSMLNMGNNKNLKYLILPKKSVNGIKYGIFKIVKRKLPELCIREACRCPLQHTCPSLPD